MIDPPEYSFSSENIRFTFLSSVMMMRHASHKNFYFFKNFKISIGYDFYKAKGNAISLALSH